MDANEIFTAGLQAERTLVVAPEHTVGHVLAGMPMVFSTPTMIMQMELASVDAVAPVLPPGFVTVGVEVNIRHLAASPVGANVRVTSKVIGVERRTIRFEVAAYDDQRKIGEGVHVRGFVDLERFNDRSRGAP